MQKQKKSASTVWRDCSESPTRFDNTKKYLVYNDDGKNSCIQVNVF